MAIGCYPVQAALIAFDHEEPQSIIAAGHTKDFQGQLADRMSSITLLFANNRMAVLTCLGEDIEAISSLKIYGTKGRMRSSCLFLSRSFVLLQAW
jgi:predicted dehydrogenase